MNRPIRDWRTRVAGALLVAAVAFAGPVVRAATGPHGDLHAPHRLPEFRATSVDGVAVASDELAGRPAAIAFFNPGSVRSWRTVAEVNARSRESRGFAFVAVANVADGATPRETVARIRRDYGLECPVLLDDGQLLTRFGAPTCCDALLLFDAAGVQRETVKFDVEHEQLLEALDEMSRGTGLPTPRTLADVDRAAARVAMLGSKGSEPLPLGAAPYTVTTFFKGTCVGCSVSGRLGTLRGLAARAGARLSVLGVFSSSVYSATDLDNIRKILNVPFAIGAGDVSSVEGFMERDRFTIVRDARGRVVWAEQPGMSEADLVEGVLAAVNSGEWQ